ncbi:DsbA family protein [Paracoccus shanxieyensis]|uniref:Thioredoxin domain-containing protein n=1 Tax=Paracoccus shanxieyensis TaxID=2675752 RepID=A0A6L6IW24_9RHOB|nr:DsbA family protein [Paracoccus shanxieyensis]MTH63841.1 thioredoxin domain-containing protein [Paracoccus shanxieyensis]MTH86647.1 thioredoxin domain-containing protein [Paracoccus shanxieyensis]
MRRHLTALALLCLLPFAALAQDRSAAETAAIKDQVFNGAGLPVMGNPDGDVTLVEFSDYNCGFCRRAAPDVAAVVASDPGVRLVIHEIPIFGEGSQYAAAAALASQKQGKYAEFHQALMAMRGRAEKASVLRVARQVGLDVARLERDMQSPEITARIEKSLELADTIGLVGTPSFVSGERASFGALPRADLAELIAEARASQAR